MLGLFGSLLRWHILRDLESRVLLKDVRDVVICELLTINMVDLGNISRDLNNDLLVIYHLFLDQAPPFIIVINGLLRKILLARVLTADTVKLSLLCIALVLFRVYREAFGHKFWTCATSLHKFTTEEQ
jgi:hypothetical protein